jgi:hypothetical protein
MGNTNSGECKSIKSTEQNQNIMVNQSSKGWKNAVNGDTEELHLDPKPTHAAFESTENIFTQSEPVESKPVMNGGLSETSEMQNYTESNANQPYYKEYMQAKTQYLNSKNMNGGLSETSEMQNYNESNANQPYYKEYLDIKQKYLNAKMDGGYIFNKISSLLQDTEVVDVPTVSNLSIDSKLNHIRSLLQDTETNQYSNNLVGNQQLKDLLLQDTETFMNFRGGNSKKDKMKHIKETTEEKSEAKESEAHEEKEKSEAHEESEAKESEADEEKEKSEADEENEKSEADEETVTSQSGGEDLDTELKVILKELQMNNKNSHKGGKSSKKSSKKSKKSKKSSKKQSKRTTESEMTNGTYDVDSESGDDKDYLTSTESMNTSDINIGHYRE